MKIKLKTGIVRDDKLGPMYGTLGDAMYFRYDEDGNLKLQVMFYGWPGLWEVAPADVDPMH